ncbi:hypothetical protein GCM10009638_14680 [Luteococcus sanguinis]
MVASLGAASDTAHHRELASQRCGPPATGTVLTAAGTAPLAVLKVLGPKALGPKVLGLWCWLRLAGQRSRGGVGTSCMLGSRERSSEVVPFSRCCSAPQPPWPCVAHVDPVAIPE